jgi:arsenite methyltransferase
MATDAASGASDDPVKRRGPNAQMLLPVDAYIDPDQCIGEEGTMGEMREKVRERYATAARAIRQGRAADEEVAGCCDATDGLGVQLYGIGERTQLPDEAVLASLGCGNPTAVADLREGDTVLDLGSGGGIDVLLSARRVGPSGRAYGLDMTDEMLHLANANARKADVTNVEFLKGYIEDIPLPDESIDVIISNCVINLSTDEPRVFDEMFRVLRVGGRLGVSDVVSADELSVADRDERGTYVGCIAGALSFGEYREGLTRVGFTDVTIEPTDELTDGMFSAIIRARKR